MATMTYRHVNGRFFIDNSPREPEPYVSPLRGVISELRSAQDVREVLSILWRAEEEGLPVPEGLYFSHVARFSPRGDYEHALALSGLAIEPDGRLVEVEPHHDDESNLPLATQAARSLDRLGKLTPEQIEDELQGDPDEATDDLLRDLDYHAAGSTPTRIAPKRME
jgi:hypothetical protein